MCVVRNNVIRRHCCDRMRNWSGRRGVAWSVETCVCVRWWCGRRRWHLSGKAGRQAAALVCSGGKSTLMNWTYLGGTARGRQEWGNGMQLSCGVATSCASGMWKAKHRPCTLRAGRTAQPCARPQHPTRPPIKDPLLLQPPHPWTVQCLWTKGQLLYLFTHILTLELKQIEKKEFGYLCSKSKRW